MARLFVECAREIARPLAKVRVAMLVRTFRLVGKRGQHAISSVTPRLLPVAGPALSTTFLRAPCRGTSRPADDSTDPEPPPLNGRPAGVGPGTRPRSREQVSVVDKRVDVIHKRSGGYLRG
jgi:hypothetical protein